MNVDNHALTLSLIIHHLYLPTTWSLNERLGNSFAWEELNVIYIKPSQVAVFHFLTVSLSIFLENENENEDCLSTV